MGAILFILLALCLVGLCVAMGRLKTSPETAKPAAVGLAVLSIVLLLARLFLGRGESSGEVIADLTASAGYAIAQRVVEGPGEPGTIVLVAPAAGEGGELTPASTGTEKGMSVALNRSPYELVLFPVNSDRIAFGQRPYISGDVMQELVQAHPGAAALVFLQCLPGPSKAKVRAPMYGIGISTPETSKGQLPKGFAAIATFRKDADWQATPSPGMTPEEVFALRYQMLPQ